MIHVRIVIGPTALNPAKLLLRVSGFSKGSLKFLSVHCCLGLRTSCTQAVVALGRDPIPLRLRTMIPKPEPKWGFPKIGDPNIVP